MFVINGMHGPDFHTITGVGFGLYGRNNDVIVITLDDGMEFLLDPGEARELREQLSTALQYYEEV